MQNRNVGIDVARAVALIGMMVAHLTYLDGVAVQVFYGFPAALFAFISRAAVGICSLCCLLQRGGIGWLAPLGRMPLTIYCIYVLTADWLALEWFGFWASLGGAILISYAWLAVFDRGPLETLLRRITAVFGKDKNEEVRS